MSLGTLYTHNNSPRTTAILVIAHALGVHLDIVYADKTDGENYKSLLEINPLGQVPTFVGSGSDSWVLRECIPIALYITSQSDTTTLLGSNRREYYEIIQWMSSMNSDVLPCISGCLMPLLGRQQPIRQNVQDCIRSMYRHFKMLDDHLAEREYLVGDDLTIADLFAVAILTVAYKSFHPVLIPDYKYMTRWFYEVYNFPFYKSVAGELDFLELDYSREGADTPP
ncbi:Elongation factor 1-gamma [Neopestalotiopsis sp. 37M]|nr:Elongation factor 1-gamma [Neopestalotiopsis sp. 37M]